MVTLENWGIESMSLFEAHLLGYAYGFAKSYNLNFDDLMIEPAIRQLYQDQQQVDDHPYGAYYFWIGALEDICHAARCGAPSVFTPRLIDARLKHCAECGVAPCCSVIC
jgi:hypothetical protein